MEHTSFSICLYTVIFSFIYTIFSYFLLLVSHRRSRYSKMMSYHTLDKPCFNYGIATFITTCMDYERVESSVIPDFLNNGTS